MAAITVQVGDDFIHELAAAIARLQLGGQAVSQPAAQVTQTRQADWPSSPPPDDDPWAAPPQSASPAALPPSTTPQAGVFLVNGPKGTQTWTLGAQGAPNCLCGVPAAHIQGSTNGRTWARFGCAKGKDKETYRGKCDFSQWA